MLSSNSDVIAPGKCFRKVFILESRAAWPDVLPNYDRATDLVLTYDFGLRQEIEALGGMVRYVDHLCDPSVMQENNFLMYRFFRDWHLDADGADIFHHRGVDFGFSFRIEIWNDFTFYVRSRLCLEQLRGIRYEELHVGAGQVLLESVLRDTGITFTSLQRTSRLESASAAYFFPVHRWYEERLGARGIMHVVRDVIVMLQGVVMSWLDCLSGRFRSAVGIYVQEYHPTSLLLQRLLDLRGIRVVQGHFSAASGLKKIFRERPIPVFGNLRKHRQHATRLITTFRQRRSARLILSTGVDVTDAVYGVIERRITSVLPRTLRSLDCVIRYLNRHPISLEILIANVGQLAMLVDSVARARGVPSYLIINGLLLSEFLDEAKYATVINSYSKSIRDHYFRGMENIVCLGDPRMDSYATAPAKRINRDFPTVVIGASAFNNLDLNSYVAVEFEFLYQVLTAIRKLTNSKRKFRVVLKVRANNYSELYRRFAQEYFPGVVDSIVDQVPMRTVLDKADFFISIYSQTLFEASCLGIPVVYHKVDQEFLDPPFDGSSEIVTTRDILGLEQALLDFLSGSRRFDPFLDKMVMEKYIGPLDGNNLERNFNFVLDLLDKNRERGGV